MSMVKFYSLLSSAAAGLTDVTYDDDEEIVWCPHCAEPILNDDYPMIEFTIDGFVCPICEEVI